MPLFFIIILIVEFGLRPPPEQEADQGKHKHSENDGIHNEENVNKEGLNGGLDIAIVFWAEEQDHGCDVEAENIESEADVKEIEESLDGCVFVTGENGDENVGCPNHQAIKEEVYYQIVVNRTLGGIVLDLDQAWGNQEDQSVEKMGAFGCS